MNKLNINTLKTLRWHLKFKWKGTILLGFFVGSSQSNFRFVRILFKIILSSVELKISNWNEVIIWFQRNFDSNSFIIVYLAELETKNKVVLRTKRDIAMILDATLAKTNEWYFMFLHIGFCFYNGFVTQKLSHFNEY